MTKADADAAFREHYLPGILRQEAETGPGVDGPMRREAYNNYVDHLAKDGQISERQAATWTHPRWLESRNPLGSHWRALL